MQTTISQYGAPAYAGMLDGVNPHNVRSYAAEEIIPIGYPVMLGTNPAKQVKKATTGAAAIGFSLHDHAREQTSAGAVQYPITDTVSTLTEGRVWVMTDDAVVAGAKANLKTATGTLTDAAVASGVEAFTQISVTFITATTAAGLALVEIK